MGSKKTRKRWKDWEFGDWNLTLMHGGCVKCFFCFLLNLNKNITHKQTHEKTNHPHEQTARFAGLKLIPQETTDMLSEETCFSVEFLLRNLRKYQVHLL